MSRDTATKFAALSKGRSWSQDPPTPAQLRAALRNHSTATAERAQLGFAESITACAVTAYRNRLNARFPVNAPPIETRIQLTAARDIAVQFGHAMVNFPVREAAFRLGSLYTDLLPDSWRSHHGIYYTPPVLVDRLLDQAQAGGTDWARAHVIDPAAGAGSFLVAAARRMVDALGDCEPAVALQNLGVRLRGFDLDPFSAWLAYVFIESEVLPLVAASGRRLPAVITVCDSLATDQENAFDLVVGNPPFGRQTLSAERRVRFARGLYGHANLYGLFMDLAVRLAKPKGLVAFLTPSSFLAGEYFKNLRGLLWREAPPVALDFVTLRKGVFEGVLQETILATYRKGGRRAPAAVCCVVPLPGEPAKPVQAGEFSMPRKATAPWVLARHTDDAGLAKRLRAMPARLLDWGYAVSTGPLVWNRHKPQLRDQPERDTVPLVWAESVTSDGRFVFRATKRNHKPYLRLRKGDDWLVVRRPCVLLQRTTAKEQARRLIAAELPAKFIGKYGVTIENHLNMLLPADDTPSIAPAVLANFLNTVAADRAFRCISGSVAVSAYELENLPLPDPTELKSLLGHRNDAASVEWAARLLYGLDYET